MTRPSSLSFLIFFTVLAGVPVASATTTSLKPDSAKECAICHYGWVDSFFNQKRGTDLAPLPAADTAADADMCFSCHDGSTVDSRKKVHNDRKHQVGITPSAKVKIPDIFPLDAEGKMNCATCHSAHGVSTEPGIERTIFLRTSNDNSGMCEMCHVDKAGGEEKGNHPLHKTTLNISRDITAYGGYTGSEPNRVICESCHVAHGGFTDRRLVLPVDQPGLYPVLCEACHGKTPGRNQDPRRNRFSHSVDVKPVSAKIPDAWNGGGEVRLGAGGEIVCVTCHATHSPAAAQNLLNAANEQDSLCLACHASQEQLIRNSKHDLRAAAPEAENSRGETASRSGPCSCCHFTHEGSGPFMWARRWEGEESLPVGICKSCHADGRCAEDAPVPATGHPIGIRPEAGQTAAEFPLYTETGATDRNGLLYCSSCHNSHQWDPRNPNHKGSGEEKGDITNSFLRAIQTDSLLCLGCHKEKATVIKTDHDLSHSAPDEQNTANQSPAQSGICGSCHLAHGGADILMWARSLPKGDHSPLVTLCLECHGTGGCAEKKMIGEHSHPVDVNAGAATSFPLYLSTGTTDAAGAIVCSTCHDSHQWNPADPESKDEEGTPADSFLRLTAADSAPLCAECHPDMRLIEGTEHDLRVSAPQEKNLQDMPPGESGVCTPCHAVHNASLQAFIWNRKPGPAQPESWKDQFTASAHFMTGLCTGCHDAGECAEKKQLEYALHPSKLHMALLQERSAELNEDAFQAFLNQAPVFTDDGRRSAAGDIVCSTCHDVHRFNARLPGKGPGEQVEGNATDSFLRKDITFTFCASCHGKEALFKFKYFHSGKGRLKEQPAMLE